MPKTNDSYLACYALVSELQVFYNAETQPRITFENRMVENHRTSFEKLKVAVRDKAEERLNIRKEFVDWSLNDIRDFRVDLEEVCKSSISEKWFYTHLKNSSDKLPRIDVLNLLSEYCGYANWDDFNYVPQIVKTSNRAYWMMLVGGLILALSAFLLWPRSKGKVLLFEDAYTKEEIPVSAFSFLKVDGELVSGTVIQSVLQPGDTIVVDGPYYKVKQVTVGSEDTTIVTVFPDDYALMLNYFSRSVTEDWDQRRSQLMEAIHPSAKIFQSHPQYSGIEMLNREEFIDRLTLPVNSLKNLEIQDVVYKDEKIYRLRFLQNEEDDE